MPFVAAYFNELDSSSNLTSPSCHSARRACPELQNPQFQKTKDHLLPGEKVPARVDEGWGKVFLSGLHPPSGTVPVSRRARVIFWMMDSETSPSVPRRMTGERQTAKCESFQIKESIQKDICCYKH